MSNAPPSSRRPPPPRRTRRQRFDAALQEARQWLRCAPESRAGRAHLDALLDRAEQAGSVGAYIVAWDCLFQFERLTLDERSDVELRAILASASAEAASKLDGWRRQAVEDLSSALQGDGPPTREHLIVTLREILKHLHQRSQNMHVKIDQLGAQIAWACLLLASATSLVLGLAYAGLFDAIASSMADTLIRATVAGALGGVMSLSLGVARSNPARAIPELRQMFRVALLRPLFGAGAAIVVAFAIEAGVIATSAEKPSHFLVLMCFIAGLSERWFLRFVDGVEKPA